MTTIAAALDYYLPAEWETQSGVMLTWPHADTIWADTLPIVDHVFAEIAREISLRQKVVITCYDKAHRLHILALLQMQEADLANIKMYEACSNDVWVRDHGPIVVKQGEKSKLLDFTFNGWGNKYPARDDNENTKKLYRQKAFGKTEILSFDMVLEGGGIEVDGGGTLMTTSSCLLSSSRNPGLTKKEIGERLTVLFGVKKILWLDYGFLEGDDTDGHIDTLARFVDPRTICYITCDDTTDIHFAELKKMEAQLRTFTNDQDEPYELIPLPWPKARYADYDGRRLPASYANFLIINNAVLVPTYDDPSDQEAIDIFHRLFPNRDIVPINSVPLIQWYGSLHCMTMQIPEGISL